MRRRTAGAGRVIPGNARPVTTTDYTAPHPQSVAIINAFFVRHLLEVQGRGGVIRFGEAGEGFGGPAGFAGELGPLQTFRGGAGLIGNTEVQSGLITGLPSPSPPGDRVPTIFTLLADMDGRAAAGLTSGGNG